MQVTEVVGPLQKLEEGRAAMAVLRLFLGGEFGEGLADLRKEEQGIVAEAVAAAGRVQDDAFGLAVKRRQRVSVARNGNHTDEAAGAVLVRNIVQLAQEPLIVGFVL